MNTIFILATAQLVMAFQDARDALVIASPSVNEPRLIHAIGVAARAATDVRIVLAPPADYLVDGNRLLVGSDPYAGAKKEFKALQSAGAALFVDPRFSAMGAQSVRRGVISGMSFAAIGTGNRSAKVSILCTGSMDQRTIERESNVCVQSDEPRIHQGLADLHRSDFDDTQSQHARGGLLGAAREVLVVSPGKASEIEALISAAGDVKIITANFEASSPLGQKVIARGNKATLVLPPAPGARIADLDFAASRGVVVTRAARPFSGTMIVSSDKVFIGSQTLTLGDQINNRQVGVVLDRATVRNMVELGARK